MADPATLAMISMGTTAVGSAFGAFGSAFQGESQAQMYEYQGGVAKINQQIASQNADWTRHAGEVVAQESGMKTRFGIGNIKTGQAKSGLDVNTGSTVDVRDSQREVGFQDQAIIRSNAAHRAYGFDVEAFEKGTQADIYKMSADKSRTAGAIGAAGSLIGGASSVADKWLQYGKNFGGQPTAASSTSWEG